MASMVAAADVITYRDERVLDLNEDELGRQRLIDDLLPIPDPNPTLKGFRRANG